MNDENESVDMKRQSPAGIWVDSAWFRILFIAMLTLGVFFRFGGLGNKIYSHDEVYTSLYANGHLGGEVINSLWDGQEKTVGDLQDFLKPGNDKTINDVLTHMAFYRPHQAPFFFVLEYYWMRFVGYRPAGVRGLAAVFGLLSIPAMYWFSGELFQSHRTALLSSAIFAISPYHILFAQDARPYSLLALVTMLSSAALLQAIQRNNSKNWVLYSLTMILGMYTHLLFVLVAIAHGLYFLTNYLKNSQNEYGGFLSACLTALLVFGPWLYYAMERMQAISRQIAVLSMNIPWYRYIQNWVLLFSSPFIDLDFNSTSGNLIPYLLRGLVLAFLVYPFIYFLQRGSWKEKTFLILIYITTTGFLIAVDLLFGGIRSITGRYFVPANIATIMVLAYFLSEKLDHTRGNVRIGWILVVGLFMLMGVFSNLNSLRSETWWNKELSRIRPEFIHEINKDDTLLIVSGSNPTNLGDILLLGFEIEQDVKFRLYQELSDINFTSNYGNKYWFPSANEDILEVRAKEQFETREVLQGTLWQIIVK